MRHFAAVPLFLSLAFVGAAEAAELRLEATQPACAVLKLFERCELTAQVNGPIANPYDSDEVTLEAAFSLARGEPVIVQGFYDEPPAGTPGWKVRFTPRQPGRWSYVVTLRTPQGSRTAPAGNFLVLNSAKRGFARFNPEQGNFRFDSGEPFVPIGENLCWGPSVGALQSYQQWFRELSRQRANFIRVWMAPWLLRLETKDTGVGRYDQARAKLLDDLLEQSESAGLFWQLCLLHHGAFSRSQDPDWQNNPYNEQLGGMCRLPNDFLTDVRAKTMFKRLLRYLVNRWGYSPQLAVWELFNEADFGEFRKEDVAAWIKEMSLYLRSIDVNRRPITTSFHHDPAEEVWQAPTIDLIQLHVYDKRDFSDVFGGAMIPELQQRFHKPVFIGEFGWSDDMVRRFDDAGIHLHEGLWSSVMGGAGGGGLVWYWDSYIHPRHLERHYRALAAFLEGETLGTSLSRLSLSVSDPRLAGIGVGRPDRAYCWFKNRAHTLDGYIAYRCESAKQRLQAARGEGGRMADYAPPVVHAAIATIKGMDWVARYRVEWWDAYRGRVVARSVQRAKWGTLTIPVPDVAFDLAAKLIKLQWWERG